MNPAVNPEFPMLYPALFSDLEKARWNMARDIPWDQFDGIATLGITAGASAPEVLVEEIMGAFAERYILDIETVTATEEGVFFPLPRPLRDHEAAE